MLTPESIGRFQAHIVTNGGSIATARAYGADLRGALEWMDGWRGVIPPRSWSDLENDLALYLTTFRTTWAPKTTTRKLTTFRSWARFMDAPMNFLGKYRPPKPAPSQPHPIPEGITGVRDMIDSAWGAKHEALLTLTGLMGLRVGEAISIRPEHFDLDDMILTVRGKGDKVRELHISKEAWANLQRAYKHAVRDRTVLVPMSNRGARKAVARHGRRAELSRPIASHDMRATFGTHLYDITKDLRLVQDALGHADPKTTQVYTGVSRRAMREGMEFTS